MATTTNGRRQTLLCLLSASTDILFLRYLKTLRGTPLYAEPVASRRVPRGVVGGDGQKRLSCHIKSSRSRRRKKTVLRKMNSTHDIGLLTTQGNTRRTHKGLNNSGGYPATSTIRSICVGMTGGVPRDEKGSSDMGSDRQAERRFGPG